MEWQVTDFKCVPQHLYTAPTLGHKARKDERKQITYEYALQLSGLRDTKSQLCIPTYFDAEVEGIGESVDPSTLHPDLRNQEIEVFRVDFGQIVKEYIKVDKLGLNQ